MSGNDSNDQAAAFKTVRDDFFGRSDDRSIGLMGSKCGDCGEVFLGKLVACQNCQSERIGSLPLSHHGILFSYTVVRNRPPGDYKGPDPFRAYPVGLVELPDGVRILSVLDCPIDALKIGMPLELSIYELYKNDEGTPVLAFKFIRAEGRKS